MSNRYELHIQGIPAALAKTPAAAVCRTRLSTAVGALMDEANLPAVMIRIGTRDRLAAAAAAEARARPADHDDIPVEVRAQRYKARAPLFRFEQLIVPEPVKDEILGAVELIRLEGRIFDDWGLREIEPFPRTILNFHGAPGTGKTLAAHALADFLGRRILSASYAEIESKFHGDGPKNVEALFFAAERDDALLFLDEADSLLSRRLTEVTQGSEQAINSMRSQLLICLEKFRGVAVFATNLVQNYDRAFETRVRHVHFPMPDEACRRAIWRRHLPARLPLEPDLSVDRLAAAADDICGRDIKNAVLDAAVRVARARKEHVGEADLLAALDRIRKGRIQAEPRGRPLTAAEKVEVQAQVAGAVKDRGAPRS
jgi:SpoVK/Ycf46/Vps4 family AAA+-type ATPase